MHKETEKEKDANEKRDVMIAREKIKNFELLGEAVKTWVLSLGAAVSVIANAIHVFRKALYPHSRRVMARVVEGISPAPPPDMASQIDLSAVLNAFGIENVGGIGVTAVLILLLIFWKKKVDKNVGTK